MSGLDFEWDPRKAALNRRKHGVSFDEAATAFADEQALVLADPDHSDREDRFVLLGLSAALRILVVVHCYREGETVIRLISARRADPTEQHQYDERWHR
ncbi:MAG TPA: BrnT family toxin [Lacipirellulaceae bacterium]|nr:BrnT family toxin [Lacipirellulaceae bacterium]